MTKKEIIWREIIEKSAKKEQLEFTQKALSQKFGFSTSTVFGALKIPRTQGAVKMSGRNFRVVDIEKFLYIWATQRDLEKEIVYETFVPGNVKEIEGLMPDGIIFGAYSAYLHKFNEAPADYGKVYVYADQDGLDEIKKRFPAASGAPNLFVLKEDNFLRRYGGADTADVQIFADIWNLRDWYAKEFLDGLKEKIIG